MFAKTIRNIFNKWFEKSIIILYKISIFFRLFISKISNILLYKLFVIFDRRHRSFIFRIFFDIFVLCYNCRICNDIFESNNDLYRYLRTIHFDYIFRHEFEKHAFQRNIMIWKFLIFWRKNKSFFYFLLYITNR